MKGNPTKLRGHRNQSLMRAFSLVEVLIAATIFAITSVALTGLFLQNLRLSKWQTSNVQVVNSTFGILDQIKNKGANEMWKLYQALPDPTQTINVTVIDPSDLSDGYKDLALRVNQKDGTENDKVWNRATLKTGRLSTSPSLPVSYWITLKRDQVKTGNITQSDVLELTLIYRWSEGTTKHNSLGQLQISFPAPNLTFK